MRGLLITLVVLAGVWLALVVAAWGLQRQLIYLPDTTAPATPDDGDVEEVTLRTDDGLELSAWHLSPPGEAATTVLVLPGNAGDRALRLPLARGLVARGHAVLLLDYRGYGGNPGRPHEAGLRADARAARDRLEAREEVDESRLAYLGESLGTAVAAALAATDPPAALVLRSPFPELADVAERHYPFLPVRRLLRDRYETERHLAAYDGPVLVVAGEEDTIVPTALSAEFAQRLDAPLVEIPEAGHNDPALLDGEAYLDAVDAFLRRSTGAPQG